MATMIIAANALMTLALCLVVRKLIRQQKELKEFVAHANMIEIQVLKCLNDASIQQLWKTRQEVYGWMCDWTSHEQYEMAEQAKKVVSNIENLIAEQTDISNLYHKNMDNGKV